MATLFVTSPVIPLVFGTLTKRDNNHRPCPRVSCLVASARVARAFFLDKTVPRVTSPEAARTMTSSPETFCLVAGDVFLIGFKASQASR
ncbi:unnamed protein product [Ixodes pacificus]